MDENVAEKKITGIRQIVRLKELLQKWQNVTLSTKESSSKKESNSQSSPSGIPPAISKRIKSSNLQCTDSDEDVDTSCQSPDPPRDVPKGYLAVYVGPELRRFTVPTTYLGDPLFKKLLEKVEEEFGFDHTGGLTIPCDVETFKYLLKCMETHHRVDLQPYEKNIEEAPLEEEE